MILGAARHWGLYILDKLHREEDVTEKREASIPLLSQLPFIAIDCLFLFFLLTAS